MEKHCEKCDQHDLCHPPGSEANKRLLAGTCPEYDDSKLKAKTRQDQDLTFTSVDI